jgi:biopolymer transport protein ExbD
MNHPELRPRRPAEGTLSAGRSLLALLTTAALVLAQSTTSRPGRRVQFQPGVFIDWRVPQVEIEARVVLQVGLLELFACTPNTREHESILQVQAPAEHIYQALGLIGLQPGHPVQWEAEREQVIPAAGAPVELLVRWWPESTSQPPREVDVSEWMLANATDRPPPPQPWVFAGSVRDEQGVLAAEYEGTIVAVVDFEGALIALPRSYSDSNAELWLRANPDAVPPVGTRCLLLVRPSATAGMTIRLDRLGRLRLSDRPVTRTELQQQAAELHDRQADAQLVIVPSEDTPQADIDTLRRLLEAAGWSAEQIEVRLPAPATRPASDPGALGELLRTRLARQRELAENMERDRQEITTRLTGRQRSAERTADGLLSGLHHLGLRLRSHLGEPATRPAEPEHGTADTQP